MSIEKTFEIERERDRFEYRVHAKFSDEIAERVEVSIVYYPMKKYFNHVTLHLTLYLEDGLNLEIRKVRDSWGGSGVDFINTITIYTTQELEDEHVFSRDRYEKISNIEDAKELVSDILELFEDFVKYYIKQVVEDFIEGEEQ